MALAGISHRENSDAGNCHALTLIPTSESRSDAGLADPKVRTQLVDLGGIILGGSSADFRTLITEETEKWGKVIRAANIKPE